jgi:hypothetical protein
MNILITLALGLAYRIRGGGFIRLFDWEYRILWGSALALAYILMNAAHPDLAYAFMILPLAYASMAWIPHAAFQNSGKWPTPQKAWPAFWLPTLTDAEWTSAGSFLRALYDFCGMQGVGLFRGLVVFAPYAATQYGFHHVNALDGVIRAIGVLMVGQPIAYVLGQYVPFSLPSLAKKSTEWSEFGVGLVYGVALSMLT